jgi:hypothetical protein
MKVATTSDTGSNLGRRAPRLSSSAQSKVVRQVNCRRKRIVDEVGLLVQQAFHLDDACWSS